MMRSAHAHAEKQLARQKAELADALKKQMKDDQGRPISKDENGKLFVNDNGTKIELSPEDQEKFKKKQEAEGLLTDDQIQPIRDRVRTAEEARTGTITAREQQDQNQNTAEEAARKADAELAAITKASEDLNTDFNKEKEELEKLTTKGSELDRKLKEERTELARLQQQLANKQNNEKELESKVKKLEAEIAKKDDELKKVAENITKAQEKLSDIKDDKQHLKDIEDIHKKMKSMTPEERSKAQKEIDKIKDEMSPEGKKHYEDHQQTTISKLDANKPQDTVVAKSEIASSVSSSENNSKTEQKSRVNGSAAPGEGIKAAANLSQFNPAAVGLPLTGAVATPEQENIFVATRVAAAPATGGVRPS